MVQAIQVVFLHGFYLIESVAAFQLIKTIIDLLLRDTVTERNGYAVFIFQRAPETT